MISARMAAIFFSTLNFGFADSILGRMESSEQLLPKPVEARRTFTSVVEPLSDRVSGWLIYAMIIFSPWAFGTTQTWSIWSMNIAGYMLGVLLLIKLLARRNVSGIGQPRTSNGERCGTVLTHSLAVLTGLILKRKNNDKIARRRDADFPVGASRRLENRRHGSWSPCAFQPGVRRRTQRLKGFL